MSLKMLVQSMQQTKAHFRDIQNIEYSKVADFYWFNLIQTKEARLITDRTFTGFDRKPEVALAKATSECVERNSFSAGYKQGLKSCSTERSDGFAAYPNIGIDNDLARSKARDNALAEALERFAWASWWDDASVAYAHKTFSIEQFSIQYLECSKVILEIHQQRPIVKIHLIQPDFENYTAHQLNIIVVEFIDGVVTGGACGNLNDELRIMTRAISELLRHALVLIQNKNKPVELSFYEKRLLYYASPDGKRSFYRRLAHSGNKKIFFPYLVIDEKIPSAETHSVHRCLFENQPAFIGGAIERMCL